MNLFHNLTMLLFLDIAKFQKLNSPVIDGLNKSEVIFKFDGENKVSMTSVDGQEMPATLDGKCVVINKSAKSRGFFLMVRNLTNISPFVEMMNYTKNGGPSLTFKDYNSETIQVFDYYWKSLDGQLDLMSNYVRGAKSLTMCFNPTAEDST